MQYAIHAVPVLGIVTRVQYGVWPSTTNCKGCRIQRFKHPSSLTHLL